MAHFKSGYVWYAILHMLVCYDGEVMWQKSIMCRDKEVLERSRLEASVMHIQLLPYTSNKLNGIWNSLSKQKLFIATQPKMCVVQKKTSCDSVKDLLDNFSILYCGCKFSSLVIIAIMLNV